LSEAKNEVPQPTVILSTAKNPEKQLINQILRYAQNDKKVIKIKRVSLVKCELNIK